MVKLLKDELIQVKPNSKSYYNQVHKCTGNDSQGRGGAQVEGRPRAPLGSCSTLG